MRGVASRLESTTASAKPTYTTAAPARAQASIGQVGDQKSERVSERAPGEPLVDRVLDRDVGTRDHGHHGRDRQASTRVFEMATGLPATPQVASDV